MDNGIQSLKRTGSAQPSLAGRKVLLGVSGGIAAYKAADLARRLIEAGAQVQVVMTDGARQFVTPLTFQALTGRAVRDSLWDAQAEAAMGHIELARWPDLILIAPASADLLARLSHGMANDLLTTLCLASDRPLFVAPAMNRQMWANPATQANLASLRSRGTRILGPGSGDQACGEVGLGRMLEPLEIREALVAALAPGALTGKAVAINAGPTYEAVDPVRVLTNRSSGKMGFALAQALAQAGASVRLIAGPVSLPTPAGVTRIDVETAAEMLDASLAAASEAEIFIGTAAIADYRPAQVEAGKIKKAASRLSLKLERTEDVISAVRKAHPELFVVGFAAETDDLEKYARDKLKRKGLDMVAANWVGGGRAFDQDHNALQVFWPGGERALAQAPKTQLASELVAVIAERLAERAAAVASKRATKPATRKKPAAKAKRR